jgi:hypothetical protein
MKQELETTEREAVLVQDAALTRVFGQPVLEACPPPGCRTSRSILSSWFTKVASGSRT